MSDDALELPEPAAPATLRSEREQQRWRNALARRKLEVMRELKRLRFQLHEPWEDGDGHQDHR